MSSFRPFLTSITLIAALILSACDSKEERKLKYFDQGVEFFTADNKEKARVSFKNVLQLDPNHVEARVYFGKLMEQEEDFRQAVGHYSRVLELEPNHLEASVRLGKLLLLFGHIERAMELATEAVVSHPDDPSGYTLKGSVLGKQEKYNNGIEYAKRALTIDDAFIEAKILLATLYAKDKQYSLAEDFLNKSIAVHPDQAVFYTLLAAVNQEIGNSDKTWAALQKVAELNKDNYSQLEIIISFLRKQGWYDKAEVLLKDFIASHEAHVKSRLAYVSVLAIAGKQDAAMTTLKGYIAEFPEEHDYQFSLAQFYRATRENEQAVKVLNDIIANNVAHPSALKARNRLAAYYIDEKRYDDALSLVNKVLEENTTDLDALTLRGTIYLAEQDTVNAIADLRRVIKERPQILRLYKMLAQAHIMSQEHQLAVDYLRKANKLFPQDAGVMIQLADLLSQTGERKEAITLYEQVLNQSADNPQLIDKLVKLYFAEKNLEKASQLIDLLAQQESALPRAHYYRGIIQQSKGQHSEALKAFDQSIALSPKAIEPISARVKSLLALKRDVEAESWLQQKIKENPKNVVLHNLAGEVNLTQNKLDEAQAQFESAIEKQPEWWMPYRRLANVHVEQKKVDQAITVLNQGVRATRGNVILRNELAAIYEREGLVEEALKQFEEALESNSENEAVINNLAMLLVSYRDDQASLDRAKELAAHLKDSKNPYFLDTAGWVHYKRGEYDLALPMIKRAVDRVGMPAMHYHLGMAYYKLNEVEQAKKHLEIATNEEGSFPGKAEAGQLLEKIKSS